MPLKEIEEFQINSTTFNSVVRNLDKVLDDYLGPKDLKKMVFMEK